MAKSRSIAGIASLLLLVSVSSAAELPQLGFEPAKPVLLDVKMCRDAALAAEAAGKSAAALDAWERIIDRCVATEDQRVEARKHIRQLHPKVPANADPAKARPWKMLAIIFRQLDFSWEGKNGRKNEVHKTITPGEEK